MFYVMWKHLFRYLTIYIALSPLKYADELILKPENLSNIFHNVTVPNLALS